MSGECGLASISCHNECADKLMMCLIDSVVVIQSDYIKSYSIKIKDYDDFDICGKLDSGEYEPIKGGVNILQIIGVINDE